jgi:broad specificity phosphatase PhoE
MLTPSAFYYLRHGETDWNVERRMQGRTDVPLNTNGLAQAARARDLLAGHEIATICTSPLTRARRTAEIVNEKHGRELVVIDELSECGFGPHEGELAGAWYGKWLEGETPAGVESRAGFYARALAGINAALAHPGPVLIVAHGGTYWAIQEYAKLTKGALANCLPVRHDPPDTGLPFWRAIGLSEQG